MINDVVGKLVADKYRIEGLIREGESGDLYAGRHEVLDKPVTVKILPAALAIDARWVKRFIDEARAVSRLTHPNILNITDFGTDARSVSYAVFEPIDGQNLGETGELDEDRALQIARQIAAAVAAAHDKNVIHGALDPKKIFANADAVKVYGFGGGPMHVERGADPRYLAPEQCTAFPAADERSDVYSLGVILYEMLSGAVPYDGATAADILAKQNSGPPAPLTAFRPDLNPEIEPIVLSAMAVGSDRRYPNMAAFAEDLEILSGRLGVPAKAAAAAASGNPKRNIWQTAFVVFAGISILAVALIYATSVKKTDPTTQLVADASSLPVQPIGPATGAQEESLAKLPPMTAEEIMAAATGQTPDMVPGGDGYNAWANGGLPPAGAPLAGSTVGVPFNNQGIPPTGYVQPGGQVYTIDPNGGSQFMPPDGGVILVPVPVNTNTAVKPSQTPKTPAGNTATQPTPLPVATPKPMATPPPKGDKPATTQPNKDKPAPTGKPAKNGRPADPE